MFCRIIPLDDFKINSELPDTLYIAAQAEIGMVDEFGDPICYEGTDEQIEETTWAYGVDEIRPGKNWAMYFEFNEFELPNSE